MADPIPPSSAGILDVPDPLVTHLRKQAEANKAAATTPKVERIPNAPQVGVEVKTPKGDAVLRGDTKTLGTNVREIGRKSSPEMALGSVQTVTADPYPKDPLAATEERQGSGWGLGILANFDLLRRVPTSKLLGLLPYLPDPGTPMGDAFSDATSSLLANTLPKSYDPDEAKAQDEALRSLGHRLYALASTTTPSYTQTGEYTEVPALRRAMSKGRQITTLESTFGPEGPYGKKMLPPSLEGTAILDAIITKDEARALRDITDRRPSTLEVVEKYAPEELRHSTKMINDYLDSPQNPFVHDTTLRMGMKAVRGVVRSVDAQSRGHDYYVYDMLSSESGRMALGMMLEMATDPTNFIGAGAGSKVIAHGKDFFRVGKDVVKGTAGLAHLGVAERDGAALFVRVAQGDMDALTTVERAASNLDHEAQTVSAIHTSVTEAMELGNARSALEEFVQSQPTGALKNVATAVEEVIQKGDPAAMDRTAKGLIEMLGTTSRGFRGAANDVRRASKLAQEGAQVTERGKWVGRVGVSRPFGNETYYPLRRAGNAIEKLRESAWSRVPAFAELKARVVKDGFSSLTAGERLAYVGGWFGTPLRIGHMVLDRVGSSLIGRAVQPAYAWFTREVGGRLSSGANDGLVGEAAPLVEGVRKIKQQAPELWDTYMDLVGKSMVRLQSLESQLHHSVARMTKLATKVAEDRKAAAKAGTGEARWGTKDYSWVDVFHEAVDHYERGSGTALPTEVVEAAKDLNAVIEYASDEMNIHGEALKQVLGNMGRFLSGDAEWFMDTVQRLGREDAMFRHASEVEGGVWGDAFDRTMHRWRTTAEAAVHVLSEVTPEGMSRALVEAMPTLGARALNEREGVELAKRLLVDALGGDMQRYRVARDSILAATGTQRVDDAFRALWGQAMAHAPGGLDGENAVSMALLQVAERARRDAELAAEALHGDRAGVLPALAQVLGSTTIRDMARARAMAPQVPWAQLRDAAMTAKGEWTLIQAGVTPRRARAALSAAQRTIEAVESLEAALRAQASEFGQAATKLTARGVMAEAMTQNAERMAKSLPPSALRDRVQVAARVNAMRATGMVPYGAEEAARQALAAQATAYGEEVKSLADTLMSKAPRMPHGPGAKLAGPAPRLLSVDDPPTIFSSVLSAQASARVVSKGQLGTKASFHDAAITFMEEMGAGPPALDAVSSVLNAFDESWFKDLRFDVTDAPGIRGFYSQTINPTSKSAAVIAMSITKNDPARIIQTLGHEFGHHLLRNAPRKEVLSLMDAFALGHPDDSYVKVMLDEFRRESISGRAGAADLGRASDWRAGYKSLSDSEYAGRMFEEWVADNIGHALLDDPALTKIKSSTAVGWMKAGAERVKQFVFRLFDYTPETHGEIHPQIKTFLRGVLDGKIKRMPPESKITGHFGLKPNGELVRMMRYDEHMRLTPGQRSVMALLGESMKRNRLELALTVANDLLNYNGNVPKQLEAAAQLRAEVGHLDRGELRHWASGLDEILEGPDGNGMAPFGTYPKFLLSISPDYSKRFSAEAKPVDTRIIEEWEAKLWTRAAPALAGMEPERAQAALLATLQNSNWLPKDIVGFDWLHEHYPQVVGQRFGELPDDMKGLVDEMTAVVKRYEELYQDTGVVRIMTPLELMKRMAVVKHFPHIPTPSSMTAHAAIADAVNDAYASLSKSTGSLDSILSTYTPASRARTLMGTVEEINSMVKATDPARVGEFTVDPMLVMAHFHASNKAITASELLASLMRMNVMRTFEDVGERKAGMLAAEAGYVPLLVQPDSRVGWHMMLTASQQELADFGVSAADVREALGQARRLRANAKLSDWASQIPLVENAYRLEDLLGEYRAVRMERGEPVLSLKEIAGVDEFPTWKGNKDWWDQFAERLSNHWVLTMDRSMDHKIVGRDLASWLAKDQNIAQLYIPASVYQSMIDTFDVSRHQPKGVITGGLKRLVDNVTTFYKTRFTILNSAFHAGNLANNEYTAALLGGRHYFSLDTQLTASTLTVAGGVANRYGSLRKARSALFEGTLSPEHRLVAAKDRMLWKSMDFDSLLERGVDLGDGIMRSADDALDLLRSKGVMNDAYSTFADLHEFESNMLSDLVTGDSARLWERAKRMASAGEDAVIILASGAVGGLPVAMPKWLGRAVGTFIENRSRVALFVSRVKDSGAIDDAAATVAKGLFNYDDLPAFQKVWGRTFIPFLTWNWKNLGLHKQLAEEKPWVFAEFHRLLVDDGPAILQQMQNERNGVAGDGVEPTDPSKVKLIEAHNRSKVHLPIPGGAQNTYLRGFRSGIEGTVEFGGMAADAANPAKWYELFKGENFDAVRLLSMSNFLALAIVTLASGHHMYYNRPISEVNNAAQATAIIATLEHIRDTTPQPVSGIAASIRDSFADALEYRPVYDMQHNTVFATASPRALYALSSMPWRQVLFNSAAATVYAGLDAVSIDPRGALPVIEPMPEGMRQFSALTGFKIMQMDPTWRTQTLQRELEQSVKDAGTTTGVLREVDSQVPRK